MSIAEQIGVLDELIAEATQAARRWSGGLEHYRYQRRVTVLTALRDALVARMNGEMPNG